MVCSYRERAEHAQRVPHEEQRACERDEEDTLGLCLQDGLVGRVGVLHGDGVGELAQHSLLEGF